MIEVSLRVEVLGVSRRIEEEDTIGISYQIRTQLREITEVSRRIGELGGARRAEVLESKTTGANRQVGTTGGEAASPPPSAN